MRPVRVILNGVLLDAVALSFEIRKQRARLGEKAVRDAHKRGI